MIREADWCTNGRALEEVRYVRVDVIQYCIASCWWVNNLFHMMISFRCESFILLMSPIMTMPV